MFLKRFIFILFAINSLTALTAGIKVKTEYAQESLKNQSELVSLINKMTMTSKETVVVFEKTDSLYRKWKVSGTNFDGAIELFVSKTRGIGWLFKLGDDSLKAVIARDYRNTNDPRLISITTNFVSGLFLVENFEPDCNSQFAVYSLKNSWDADVEYTGDYALEMFSSNPCGEGQWKIKTGKLKMMRKIQFAAIFTAAMTQNIRLLFKDFVLE